MGEEKEEGEKGSGLRVTMRRTFIKIPLSPSIHYMHCIYYTLYILYTVHTIHCMYYNTLPSQWCFDPRTLSSSPPWSWFAASIWSYLDSRWNLRRADWLCCSRLWSGIEWSLWVSNRSPWRRALLQPSWSSRWQKRSHYLHWVVLGMLLCGCVICDYELCVWVFEWDEEGRRRRKGKGKKGEEDVLVLWFLHPNNMPTFSLCLSSTSDKSLPLLSSAPTMVCSFFVLKSSFVDEAGVIGMADSSLG